MSFVVAGLTHCKKCNKPLQRKEHYLCENCRKKEEKKMGKIYRRI